jgi:anti-anti-sigma regulatory factor
VLHGVLDEERSRRGDRPQEDDITMLLLTAQRQPSTLDNGLPSQVASPGPARSAPPGEVLMGSVGELAVIRIHGDGTWALGRGFHDTCMRELDAGRAIVLDLSSCTHLDSTLLGTIQEIVVRAGEKGLAVRLQGLPANVRQLFEELGMEGVLRCVSAGTVPLPARMSPLETPGADEAADRWRIVLAHEALASLNEKNHEEFIKLVECVRKELEQLSVKAVPS